MTKADFQKYKDKIERLLRQEALNVEQLVDSFPPKRQEQVLKALSFLLDEGYIDKTEEQLHWNA